MSNASPRGKATSVLSRVKEHEGHAETRFAPDDARVATHLLIGRLAVNMRGKPSKPLGPSLVYLYYLHLSNHDRDCPPMTSLNASAKG